MYSLGKKLIQIFAPNMVSAQQWMYADFLAPILFPTPNKMDGFINIGGRSDMNSPTTNNNNNNETDWEYEASLLNQTYQAGLSNETSLFDENNNQTRLKRSALLNENEEASTNNSSGMMDDDVMKNLAYLENDPNAFFKPSSPFFSLLTGSDRGLLSVMKIKLSI